MSPSALSTLKRADLSVGSLCFGTSSQKLTIAQNQKVKFYQHTISRINEQDIMSLTRHKHDLKVSTPSGIVNH
jgi:hypothetical protein